LIKKTLIKLPEKLFGEHTYSFNNRFGRERASKIWIQSGKDEESFKRALKVNGISFDYYKKIRS